MNFSISAFMYFQDTLYNIMRPRDILVITLGILVQAYSAKVLQPCFEADRRCKEVEGEESYCKFWMSPPTCHGSFGTLCSCEDRDIPTSPEILG